MKFTFLSFNSYIILGPVTSSSAADGKATETNYDGYKNRYKQYTVVITNWLNITKYKCSHIAMYLFHFTEIIPFISFLYHRTDETWL